MVSGRAAALTAASPFSQCAETTRIATGLPSVSPNPQRNSRAKPASIGNVGAPWETNMAGKRSGITPAHPLRHEHGFGLAFTFHQDVPDHLHAAVDALEFLEFKTRAQARARLHGRGEAQAVASINPAPLPTSGLSAILGANGQQ